jgi:hypothetical protein
MTSNNNNNTKGTNMNAAQLNNAHETIALLNDERAYWKASIRRLDPVTDDLGEITSRIEEINAELARLRRLVG